MKIFISWSGERSKSAAQALQGWIKSILQFSEPWFSSSDIEAGERWATEIGQELEQSNFGIVCVTPENVQSPWIHFEAGALAKSLTASRVVPLLLKLEFSGVSGPLTQFQAKKADKAGLRQLLSAINNFAGDSKIDEALIDKLFEALWPAFEAEIAKIPDHPAREKPNRPEREVLEELVVAVRGISLQLEMAEIQGHQLPSSPSRVDFPIEYRVIPADRIEELRFRYLTSGEPGFILDAQEILSRSYPRLHKQTGLTTRRLVRGFWDTANEIERARDEILDLRLALGKSAQTAHEANIATVWLEFLLTALSDAMEVLREDEKDIKESEPPV